jgi:hypothetical protein
MAVLGKEDGEGRACGVGDEDSAGRRGGSIKPVNCKAALSTLIQFAVQQAEFRHLQDRTRPVVLFNLNGDTI